MKEYNTTELVEEVSERTGLTKDITQKVLIAAFEVIKERLFKVGRLEFKTLGVFSFRFVAPRKYSAFKPGAPDVEKPERVKIKFTPSESFRQIAEKETGKPCV